MIANVGYIPLTMNDCSDVQELGTSSLEDFDKRIAALPPDLCAPFHQEAQQLVAVLLTIYKVVVQRVRREEELQKIAICWGCMVQVCDEFSKRLSDLRSSHPDCGATMYYDQVLDLRNKCLRLQNMHS